MNFEQTRKLLTEKLSEAWTSKVNNPDLPLVFDRLEKPDHSYAKFFIQYGTTESLQAFATADRTPIIFGVQIFIKSGSQTKAATIAADGLSEFFNHETFLSVDQKTSARMETLSVRYVGESKGFELFNLSISSVVDNFA